MRDEPTILEPYKWLWLAFTVLSQRRYRFENPQPIQLSEIMAYASFNGVIDEVLIEQLYNVVTALDAVYMTHHWDAVQKAQDKAAAATGARRK